MQIGKEYEEYEEYKEFEERSEERGGGRACGRVGSRVA